MERTRQGQRDQELSTVEGIPDCGIIFPSLRRNARKATADFPPVAPPGVTFPVVAAKGPLGMYWSERRLSSPHHRDSSGPSAQWQEEDAHRGTSPHGSSSNNLEQQPCLDTWLRPQASGKSICQRDTNTQTEQAACGKVFPLRIKAKKPKDLSTQYQGAT